MTETTREKQLHRALTLAVGMLGPHEPGDSRAVSDEFVALAAVSVGIDDAACWTTIDAGLNRLERANART